MKSSKPSLTFKSFQDLKASLKNKPFPLPERHPTNLMNHDEKQNPELEEELFKKAMEGVAPISRDNFVEKIFQTGLPESSIRQEDAETLEKLADLVKYGKGFNVADTPEYIEGTNYRVHPTVAKRLHRGDYSIQAFVDLHGLLAEDAKEVFEKFLKWAVTTGKTESLNHPRSWSLLALGTRAEEKSRRMAHPWSLAEMGCSLLQRQNLRWRCRGDLCSA